MPQRVSSAHDGRMSGPLFSHGYGFSLSRVHPHSIPAFSPEAKNANAIFLRSPGFKMEAGAFFETARSSSDDVHPSASPYFKNVPGLAESRTYGAGSGSCPLFSYSMFPTAVPSEFISSGNSSRHTKSAFATKVKKGTTTNKKVLERVFMFPSSVGSDRPYWFRNLKHSVTVPPALRLRGAGRIGRGRTTRR